MFDIRNLSINRDRRFERIYVGLRSKSQTVSIDRNISLETSSSNMGVKLDRLFWVDPSCANLTGQDFKMF